MTTLDQAYSTRDLVLRRLEEDLLGGEFDEVLTERPLARFITGILYPLEEGEHQVSLEEVVEGDDEVEAGSTSPDAPVDPSVALSKVRYPRSMGLTFSVDDEVSGSVHAEVTAAVYREDAPTATDGSTTAAKRAGEMWRRSSIPPHRVELDLAMSGTSKTEIVSGLEFLVTVRAPRDDGARSVTLSLVNNREAPRGARDTFAFYAPRITVTAPAERIVPRPGPVLAGADAAEARSQALLFRDVPSLAVGHGCAVEWSSDASAGELTLTTSFVPRHELLLSDPRPAPDVDLGMVHLGDVADYSGLSGLVDGYERWIDAIDASRDSATHEESEVVDRHVADARHAASRMRDGIRLLEQDERVRHAFRLMNRAMAEQRARQDHHRAGNLGDPPRPTGEWRPFQMAFILMNLSSLVDETHDEREIADVLWFPTGGGKTEAYLGLIGVSILLRRLKDPRAAGVSVLMRYTLRLLTLQQYQRATGLICALELQRQMHLSHAQPISIGLWVGQGSTPNRIDDARKALNRARRGHSVDEIDDDSGDPVQLRQCPWCGTPLDHRHYEIVDRSWMKVACGNAGCAYRNGLPVHIVDDDVYRERPSLVIATVDKFAMMPWKEDVGKLLGSPGSQESDRLLLPPDFIVQDELHLISGPLGTVVGLYETAVDAICGRETRPKVIASTATIRRAAEQVKAVFAREARQFPPPGIDYRDSYFAVEADRNSKGTRQYVGVMAPGASHATLMVRVYASLLQSASVIPIDDDTADLYWTLLGYFNSLRVLGSAFIQSLDDVPDQIGVVARRRGEEPRERPGVRELTSRKKSWEIPKELEILASERGATDAADIVLATNMISVGVDVDRLGLMVVMGQPQTSSEYIQATSRVGRRMPGLVVTLYNSSRSRDLSHYENFTAYHRMLYRHVEATGATPFAPRARDRALHAVLVSLARHLTPEAGPTGAAAKAGEWVDALEGHAETILARLEATRTDTGDAPKDESADSVRTQLQELIDEWVEARHLERYEGWFGRTAGALLCEASAAVTRSDERFAPHFPPEDPPWPTLTSMRDVDAESTVYLVSNRRPRRGR